MPRIASLKLALLPLAAVLCAALCLAAIAPAQASNATKPDCWKVPGHPDCLYPPYPGYSNSDLTTRLRPATPGQVPAQAPVK